MSGKVEHRPAHAPGAQGHDDTLRAQIDKLQAEHANMMGNVMPELPEDSRDDQAANPGADLYYQQEPEDSKNRRRAKGGMSNVTRRSKADGSGGAYNG